MTKRNERLVAAILETADGLHEVGIMDDETHAQITMRHIAAEPDATPKAMDGAEVRSLRKHTHMSQAVFARHLNLTPGYISQLERGTKRPTGAALALLDVVRRKGIEAIL